MVEYSTWVHVLGSLSSSSSFFFFFCVCGKFRVKKLIITQKPHTVFGFVCGSTQRIVGLSLSRSFPTWKREKRDHLSTLWQKILQREQLNPWTTESTLPQTDTSPSLSWNRGPKHKSAKQCHKNLLHFDLSQKAEKRSTVFFLIWLLDSQLTPFVQLLDSLRSWLYYTNMFLESHK